MKVFYQDYSTDESIDSNEPKEADLEFALDLFYELTDEEDNFFGVTDDNNERTIQFMYIKQDTWLVDIPDMKKDGSWNKEADYDECVSLIRDFYNGIPISMTSFIFNSYPSATS
ncbi:MAG: hypothetical protein LBE91_15335 [Tannerella sp.]|jgi:hypothetical protein|nr:hypothetical protein [Tannerella sp.]